MGLRALTDRIAVPILIEAVNDAPSVLLPSLQGLRLSGFVVSDLDVQPDPQRSAGPAQYDVVIEVAYCAATVALGSTFGRRQARVPRHARQRQPCARRPCLRAHGGLRGRRRAAHRGRG
jgi:hypothetical protein